MAWEPYLLPGLAGWWRADDIGLADGAAVASWSDRTSNANTLTQATTGAKPTYKATGGPNSLPAVRFARASTQNLAKSSPTGLPNAQADMSVFVVASLLANQTSGTNTALCGYAKTGGFAGWHVGYTSTGSSDNLLFTTSGVKNYASTLFGTNASDGFRVVTYDYTASSKAVDFGRNFITGADHVTGTTAATTGPDTMMIGGSPASGANAWVDADIAEVIVVTGILSTANKRKLSEYIFTRYGLVTGTFYNASSALTTPAYDGSGTCVESSIIYDAAGGFTGGATYLNGFVPYHSSSPSNENPSLLSSTDGLTWGVPTGITNPLVPYSGTNLFGNNSDPSLFDNRARDGKIYLYFQRENATTLANNGTWYISSSDNGGTWTSAAQTLAATTGSDQYQEPQVIYDAVSGNYYMFSLNKVAGGASAQVVERRSASTPTGTWSAATTCSYTIPGSRGIWHWGRFMVYNGNLYTGASDSDTNRNLWIIKSSDLGLTWSATKRPILVPSANGWDKSYMYRGNLLPNADGVNLDLWYNGDNNGVDGAHMGYITIPLSELPSPSYIPDERRVRRNVLLRR